VKREKVTHRGLTAQILGRHNHFTEVESFAFALYVCYVSAYICKHVCMHTTIVIVSSHMCR